MTVFNKNNENWKSGDYPLFLGEKLGLYDSVNRPYVKLYELYEIQKSVDWSHNEVDLSKARADFKVCSKSEYEAMLLTIAYQWEADSMATRGLAPLLAPFCSNSEFWTGAVRITDVENLHALTYSEIVRQCVPNPDEVINLVYGTESVLDRASVIKDVFDDFQLHSGLEAAGRRELSEIELQVKIIEFLTANYALESIEFMASFAVTFNLGERGLFLPIVQLVGKIAVDEQIHYRFIKETLKILMNDPKWSKAFNIARPSLKSILDDVVRTEVEWSEFLMAEGRTLVGLNKTLLDEWVYYRAKMVYDWLGVEFDLPVIESTPLKWMDKYLDINSTQVAPQEITQTNYQLNSMANDLTDDDVFEL